MHSIVRPKNNCVYSIKHFCFLANSIAEIRIVGREIFDENMVKRIEIQNLRMKIRCGGMVVNLQTPPKYRNVGKYNWILNLAFEES